MITYKEKTISPLIRNPKTVLEFNKRQIQRQALNVGWNLEVLLEEPAYAIVSVNKEHTKTKHRVYCFDKIKTCDCKRYTTDKMGYCEHIAIVESLSRINNKLKFRLNTSKNATYKTHVYDSMTDSFMSFGTGHTLLKCPNYDSQLLKTKTVKTSIPPKTFSSFQINSVSGLLDLLDYQLIILSKMLGAKRAICALPTGSGKTITTISALKEIGKTTGILIICPKSVMNQWKSEIFAAIGESAVLISKTSEIPHDRGIGITTYQFFQRNYLDFLKINYNVVICDEIQFIRNSESKTWKTVSKLKSDYFYGLSATPIENRLDDLFNIMEIIDEDVLGPFWKFEEDFKIIKSISTNKILYEHDINNIGNLISKIENNVFTAKTSYAKPENCIDLMVDLDSESKKKHDHYYTEVKKLIAQSLSTKTNAFALNALIQSMLLKTRQCCNSLDLINKTTGKLSPKLLKFLDVVQDVCITNKQKLVVYSEWTEMLDILEKHLPCKFVRFDGSMNLKQRKDAIEIFKKDLDCMVFLSSDAGALGVDGLQLATHNILHFELPWNPAKIDQRNGRLNRLGQKHDITVYKIIAKNSIESNIFDLLKDKRKIRTQVLSATEVV